jgi:hypothetical protein
MTLSQISWCPHFILGAALCLAGWTLYWLGLHLAGGILGAGAGGALAWGIAALAKIADKNTVWAVAAIGAVVGLAAGIFLIRKLHRLFFFCAGACIGLAVGWFGFEWGVALARKYLESRGVPYDPLIWRLVALAAGTLLGGIVMMYGSKWVVAGLTSVAGAVLLALSIPDPLALLGVVPVAAGSFFFQIGLLRRLTPAAREKHEKKAEKEE